MATTIASGTNPYKLGSPPDFGTLYSGRALDFDGVADYVEVSDHPEHDVGTGDFSISAWIKIDDSTTINSIVSKSTNDDGTAPRWFLRAATNGTLRMNVADTSDDLDLSSTFTVNDGNWHHIVVVVDRGTGATFYKDGGNTEVKANTSGDGNVDNNGKLRIGIYSTSNYFDGKIANLQLWDTILSESDVQYAYTHPEKLITDNSAVTSGTTISNLKAWYPCTEGNPRSPQTTVYDGSPKELGSEMVTTNGGFDSDTTGWTPTRSTIASVSGGATGNCLEITRTSASTQYAAQGLGTVATVGKVYKITWQVKSGTSGDEAYIIRVWDGSDYIVGYEGTSSSSWVEGAAFWTAAATTVTIELWKNSATVGTMLFDTISVKEVKMGQHVATTFYGDEMHTLSTCTSPTNEADATTGWTNVGFDTFASDTKGDEPAAQGSHSLHLTAGDSGDYCKLASAITLVEGRAYEINITYIINGVGKSIMAKWGSSDGGTEYGANTLNSQSWYTAKTTLTATGTALYIQLHEAATGDDSDGYIGTISVKEIGVAAGWTTADAEPLIPQTALMGMSKPMVFDGVDNVVSCGNILTSTISSYSVWVMFDDIVGNQDVLIHHPSGVYIRNDDGQLKVFTDGSDYVGHDSLFTANKLYHIVFTSDGTTFKIYANGVELSQDDTSSAEIPVASTSFNIGGGGGTYIRGRINETSFWGITLSLAEVQELFNDGVPLDATTLYPIVKEVQTSAELSQYLPTQASETHNQSDPDGGTDAILITPNASQAPSAELDVYEYNHDNRAYVVGEIYKYTIWAKKADSGTFTGGTLKLVIREAGSTPRTDYEMVLTDKWQEFSVEHTMTKATGTLDLYIGGYGSWKTGDGAIYFYNPRLYLMSGPSGYWRNDGSVTWTDRSINSNNGTPAGSPETILLPEGTTSGKDILGFPLTHTNNGWLNLSGLEYVDAGDSSVLDIRSAITIEAWIKPAIIDQDGLIIGRYNGTTGAQTYKMYLYTDEYIYFDLYLATSKKETKSTSTVVAGTWYHLVATYDGSHQRLYFNGVLQDEDAETGLIDNDDASFTIGSGTDGATKFNGSIDEVRVYNRALTAFEADGSAPEVGETLTSGEIYKNYKHGLSKHS